MPSLVEVIQRSHVKANRIWGGGYTGDLLDGRFDTDPVHAWFQRRHSLYEHRLVSADHICRITDERGDHAWKVPLGVRYALHNPLVWSQIVTRYPWYVTWISPRDLHRYKKKFESLASAIVFVTTRAQYVDPQASIISRTGYDIPPALRNKLPHPKLGYWCPCCMDARKFYAVRPEQQFYTIKKIRSEGHFTFKERKLRVLKCKVCGLTNRDAKFRRSNQPWTTKRLKSGATRTRRRRR